MTGVAIRIHLVEDRTHDVEVAREARSGVHNEETDPVSDVHLQGRGLVLKRLPIEHDVARLTVQRVLPVRLPQSRAVPALDVELALHQDEFLVRLAGPPTLRI